MEDEAESSSRSAGLVLGAKCGRRGLVWVNNLLKALWPNVATSLATYVKEELSSKLAKDLPSPFRCPPRPGRPQSAAEAASDSSALPWAPAYRPWAPLR